MKTLENIDKYLNEGTGKNYEKKFMKELSDIEKKVFRIVNDISKIGRQYNSDDFSNTADILDNIIDQITLARDSALKGFIDIEGE